MTKVCALSDTHCLHRQVKVEPCDVLIFAGDFSNIGEMGVLEDFVDWIYEQPCKNEPIIIAGNHDRCLENINTKDKARKILNKKTIYLENSGCEIEGLKIWGSPMTSTLPSWSFVETDEAKRYEFWKQIPENLDILVTHGPPRGVMDEVPDWQMGELVQEKCGDGMLLAEVTVKKPKCHIFGHIHEGYGIEFSKNTTFMNVSQCDPFYRIKNPPRVFNI